MTDIPTITQEEAVEMRARLCALLLDRDGADFDGEVHLTSAEAREVIAALSPNMDHAVGGVRPLDTAPKDGSYFLMIGTNFDGGMAVVHWNDWWYLDDGKNFEIALRNESRLTGWLPLPSTKATTPPVNQDAVREADEEPCPNGSHCCCCGPGEKCCDCGAVMPIPQEIDALRRALADLTRACEEADALEDLPMGIDGSLLDAANEALEMQYPVIWSDEDVAKLQAHQDESKNHPYTCGGDRSDAAHRAQAEEDGNDAGTLIPTKRGWRCLSCEYRQFWAHGVTNALATPPLDNTGLDAATVDVSLVAELLCNNADARIIAGEEMAPSYADSDMHVQSYWLALARALASGDRS